MKDLLGKQIEQGDLLIEVRNQANFGVGCISIAFGGFTKKNVRVLAARLYPMAYNNCKFSFEKERALPKYLLKIENFDDIDSLVQSVHEELDPCPALDLNIFQQRANIVKAVSTGIKREGRDFVDRNLKVPDSPFHGHTLEVVGEYENFPFIREFM